MSPEDKTSIDKKKRRKSVNQSHCVRLATISFGFSSPIGIFPLLFHV
jgi:hypothetical protein